MSRALLLLLSLVIAGCATSAGARTYGVVVVPEGGGGLQLDMRGTQVPLRGPEALLRQLERLDGARIGIWGTARASGVRARRYQLLEAPDGMAPYVGRLVVDQGGVLLKGEHADGYLVLRGPELAFLQRLHGAQLWVTGGLVESGVLLVAHWGVLIDAP